MTKSCQSCLRKRHRRRLRLHRSSQDSQHAQDLDILMYSIGTQILPHETAPTFCPLNLETSFDNKIPEANLFDFCLKVFRPTEGLQDFRVYRLAEVLEKTFLLELAYITAQYRIGVSNAVKDGTVADIPGVLRLLNWQRRLNRHLRQWFTLQLRIVRDHGGAVADATDNSGGLSIDSYITQLSDLFHLGSGHSAQFEKWHLEIECLTPEGRQKYAETKRDYRRQIEEHLQYLQNYKEYEPTCCPNCRTTWSEEIDDRQDKD